MYQHQQQRQSPAKKTDLCYRCKKTGHWVQNCPENPYNRSPEPRVIHSDEQYPATYCRCGAGPCIILISNSVKNPDQKYYKCPGKKGMDCGYFKFCDPNRPGTSKNSPRVRTEEIKEVQPERYPICGCGAGICEVLVEQSGVNNGRKYFACRVKKGEGACNFKQWLDESPEADTISIPSDNPVADLTSLMDEELTAEEEMQFNAIEIRSLGSPDPKVLQKTCDARGFSKETLEVYPSPVKDNVFGNLNQCSTSQVDNNMQVFVTAGKFSPSDAHQVYGIPSNPPSNDLHEGNLMTVTILMEFEKLAQNLKNRLITTLDSISPRDHDIMTNEAGRTFEALNRLQVDYTLFQQKVNEYINQASFLAHIEKIIEDDISYQDLVNHRDYEKQRLEQLSQSRHEANTAFKASSSLFYEKASCHDGSPEFDLELSLCKAENSACLETFLQITKDMAECKESLHTASLKAEEAVKKSEELEKGRNVAWDAFQKAKVQLLIV